MLYLIKVIFYEVYLYLDYRTINALMIRSEGNKYAKRTKSQRK